MSEKIKNSSGHEIEEEPDYSRTIFVKSMLEIYRDVENSRCDCGGKFFPNGPVGMKSPEHAEPQWKYELMMLFCTDCKVEIKRIYAVDTSSREFNDEQRRAYSELPRWERHTQGNPISTDDEE